MSGDFSTAVGDIIPLRTAFSDTEVVDSKGLGKKVSPLSPCSWGSIKLLTSFSKSGGNITDGKRPLV